MILRNNIFVFFILGLIPVLYFIFPINENFIKYGLPNLFGVMFDSFIPMIVAILMNLTIKFQKNIKIKKILQIVMIITNIFSVIYLAIIVFLMYVGATMFDGVVDFVE